MNNMIDQLLPIFRNVFDNDDLIINTATTAQDVEGWDSLAHIRLMTTIEKSFGLRFSAAEISDIENIGHLAQLILAKQTHD